MFSIIVCCSNGLQLLLAVHSNIFDFLLKLSFFFSGFEGFTYILCFFPLIVVFCSQESQHSPTAHMVFTAPSESKLLSDVSDDSLSGKLKFLRPLSLAHIVS